MCMRIAAMKSKPAGPRRAAPAFLERHGRHKGALGVERGRVGHVEQYVPAFAKDYCAPERHAERPTAALTRVSPPWLSLSSR